MTKAKKIGGFIIVLLAVLVFQQVASFIGGQAANALGYKANDPNDPYMWISVHHIVQMAIGLLLIAVLKRSFHLDFHMPPRADKTGFYCLIGFSVIVGIVTAAGYHLMYPSSNSIYYNYELNARNVAGVLGFQLLLSGPSEEIIFRALPIVTLCAVMSRKCGKKEYGIAIFFASVLFSLGHVSWYTDPFRLSFSWFQLGYCFLYGIAYGVVYLKTRSLLYPMVMHSVSNIIMVGMGYVMKLIAPWP